ncbi:hypothetical protein D9758_017868 [Tetrapyrgos nigripes]|uniref:Uncharacterized protein n=1 Tax=Tetrapyrgos nigripes TaxID=182062 RepID=A0A8H5C3R0_9AGAR|nr:hypothetical protein D9758_017868 [Tetrapyrgos nigripes]
MAVVAYPWSNYYVSPLNLDCSEHAYAPSACYFPPVLPYYYPLNPYGQAFHSTLDYGLENGHYPTWDHGMALRNSYSEMEVSPFSAQGFRLVQKHLACEVVIKHLEAKYEAEKQKVDMVTQRLKDVEAESMMVKCEAWHAHKRIDELESELEALRASLRCGRDSVVNDELSGK